MYQRALHQKLHQEILGVFDLALGQQRISTDAASAIGTMVHEQTHVRITGNSTLGMVAVVCAVYSKWGKNRLVVDAATGFLDYFIDDAFWIEEGCSTAVEFVWAEISMRIRQPCGVCGTNVLEYPDYLQHSRKFHPEDSRYLHPTPAELLQNRPQEYLLPAMQFLQTVAKWKSAFHKSELLAHTTHEQHKWLEALAIAALSPPLPPKFFGALLANESYQFRRLTGNIWQRFRVLQELKPDTIREILRRHSMSEGDPSFYKESRPEAWDGFAGLAAELCQTAGIPFGEADQATYVKEFPEDIREYFEDITEHFEAVDPPDRADRRHLFNVLRSWPRAQPGNFSRSGDISHLEASASDNAYHWIVEIYPQLHDMTFLGAHMFSSGIWAKSWVFYEDWSQEYLQQLLSRLDCGTTGACPSILAADHAGSPYSPSHDLEKSWDVAYIIMQEIRFPNVASLEMRGPHEGLVLAEWTLGDGRKSLLAYSYYDSLDIKPLRGDRERALLWVLANGSLATLKYSTWRKT